MSRREALELLACGFGVAETAERLEVSLDRLETWMTSSRWESDFEAARLRVDQITSTRLSTLGTRALSSLIEIADDPTTPVRTRASIWTDLLNRSGLSASVRLTDGEDMDRDAIVELLKTLPGEYLSEALTG